MELARVTMRLDTREIGESLVFLRENSKRLPSYLANKAGRFVALRAQKNMPKVPTSRIQSELNQAVALVKAKNTGKFRRGAAFQVRNRLFGRVERPYKPAYKEIPLLALIIQARANPDSNYNERTGGVFAGPSPFRGVSRSEGAMRMLARMRRVFGSRMSSTGFFRVCANVVALAFNAAVSPLPFQVPVTESGEANYADPRRIGNVSKNLGRLADVKPATGIRDDARAEFWVAATEPDTKGSPGKALFRIAEPVWQQAIDDEARSIRGRAEELYAQAARQSGIRVV